MSLSQTPKAERPHVTFFGKTNVGKSSLVNAITGQNLSLVSEQKGTTTDPVEKAIEILPAGPLLIIDTPGLDDTTKLGAMRVARAKRELTRTDVAVVVLDATALRSEEEDTLIHDIAKAGIPKILVYNKCDLAKPENAEEDALFVSATKKINIDQLQNRIADVINAQKECTTQPLISDLVCAGELCILVVPIDSSAPKGRIILPQQMVLRDLLDCHAKALVVQPEELAETLAQNCKPKLVVCDSQAFAKVSEVTPADIPLTSFSILLARYKGTLETQIEGLTKIAKLSDNDSILMAEGCTHKRQCEDIGTVKIPRWIRAHTKKELTFVQSQGKGYPEDLSPYAMVILCGGCMVNAREMLYRLQKAKEAGIAVTNYGLCIAYMKGTLARSLASFPHLSQKIAGVLHA